MRLRLVLLSGLAITQISLPAAREVARACTRLAQTSLATRASLVSQSKSIIPVVSLRLQDQSNLRAYMALAGLTAAAAVMADNVYNDSEIVKPAWAVKYIPNGVPKELDDQIKFMQNPHYFTRLGASLPKGILLYGPPGTGKTSIARAIAEELGVTFISASATDLTSKYHGEAGKIVRDLFSDARAEAQKSKNKTVVVFIDEIDLIVPHRNSPTGERAFAEQITTFLTEIDGFARDPQITIYIIGATNRKEAIDQAILRSGRLEVHVLIPVPMLDGRIDILRHYLKDVMYRGNDIVADIAAQTEGASGADLKRLVNDAAILAGSEQATMITEVHLMAALSRMKLSESSKKNHNSSHTTTMGERI